MIALGGVELMLAILLFGGGALGLPVSVPPLPPDALIERSAPEECLLHVSTRGMAEPSAASTNLTEKLLANDEVREFVGELAGRLLAALKKSPAMNEPAVDAVDQAVVLLGTLLSQPASLTVSKVSIDPAAGPPSIDAAFVVKCGERMNAVKMAIDRLLATVFEGAPEEMRPKQVRIGGRDWSRLELPVGGQVTWGFGGTYFILTVGNDATERLLERLADKTSEPPAWKAALEQRMPVEKLSTLTYVNASAMLRLARELPKLGGPEIPDELLEATGLSGLETVGAVTGLSDQGFAASLWIGLDGEPTGVFAAPQKGIGLKTLQSVPRDAVMAQLWKLDLAKSIAAGIELAERLDPAAAAEVREGLERFGKVVGMEIEKDLLEPLGDDWSFFVVPGGGLIPAMAFQVSIDDRAAFEKAHDRLLGMALAEAGAAAGVTVRKIEYRGQTLHCLKSGVAAPLPLTPTWCLAEDRLLVTISPQLMKTLLARDADTPGLDAIPEVKRATAAGDEAMVGYLEPSALLATLFGLYEMGSPIVEAGLAQQQIALSMPELPAASAVASNVRPSITVVRQVKGARGGILVDSSSTIPLGPLSSGGGMIGASPVSGPVVVALLLPAVQAAREAARRTQSMNNYRQIMLAILTHEAAQGRLPAPAICDKAGKPLLSWRVAILPYLEEKALYDRFHLDEPWDSDHNKQLLPLLPEVYRDPAATQEEIARGLTACQVLRGEKTAFPKDAEGPRITAISDGTSKTVAVVEASREKTVPWTKPEDLAFDRDKPLDGLGHDRRPNGLFLAAFFDGHIEMLPREVPPALMKSLVTPNANDTADANDTTDPNDTAEE